MVRLSSPNCVKHVFPIRQGSELPKTFFYCRLWQEKGQPIAWPSLASLVPPVLPVSLRVTSRALNCDHQGRPRESCLAAWENLHAIWAQFLYSVNGHHVLMWEPAIPCTYEGHRRVTYTFLHTLVFPFNSRCSDLKVTLDVNIIHPFIKIFLSTLRWRSNLIIYTLIYAL